jgi:uncharacterized hydrophobic protein (TIGR00271 family)
MDAKLPDHAAQRRARVRESIHAGAALTPTYAVMNLLATVIACYGLLADSTAGVIGAMVVAMLLGPLNGVGLALVDQDLPLLGRSLVSEAVGVVIVMATAWLIGLLNADVPLGPEILARTRPGSSDLAIALAAGIAATIMTVRDSAGTSLVGVAIATALVPPLATCSMLLARGANEMAASAFLLAFTNMVAIQFASSVVFWVAGFHPTARGWAAAVGVLRRNLLSLLLLVVLGSILGISTRRAIADQAFEGRVRKVLQDGLEGFAGAQLSEVRLDRGGGRVVVQAVVHYPGHFTAQDVARLERALPAAPRQQPVSLRVRRVAVEVLTRDGPAGAGAGPVTPTQEEDQ